MNDRERVELLRGVMVDVTTWKVWETFIDGDEYCTMRLVEHDHPAGGHPAGKGCRACHLMDEFETAVRIADRSDY